MGEIRVKFNEILKTKLYEELYDNFSNILYLNLKIELHKILNTQLYGHLFNELDAELRIALK